MAQVFFFFSLFRYALLQQMQGSPARLKIQGGHAEDGQGLVEYAFILVLVALVVIMVVALYGNSVESLYDFTINKLVDTFTGGDSP